MLIGQHHHNHGAQDHHHHHDTLQPVITTPQGLTITPIQGSTPWTSLKLNNDPDKFQFAIVTDRTGGHRPGVFMDAVNKLNLLQPEFVMSIGDLIEGYITDVEELNMQWDEFDGFVKKLEMPFFYIPGNHDITNQVMEDLWKERLGPTFYHFVYKDVLFLALNSEDQRKGAGKGTISKHQYEYAKKVLEQNSNVRWTFLFMHQPLWNQKNTYYWNDIENLLKDRKHTVFTGHEHRYVKYRRNNANYFVLATTGGVSPLKGPKMGEFDHVTWVTMTKNGPVLANLQLEGIWDENVFTEETRNFVDSISAKTPFRITPIYLDNDEFEKGIVPIKIYNEENIPIVVHFEEKSSIDLIGFLDRNEVKVAPNSVEIVNLQMTKRNNSIDKPINIQTLVSYKIDSNNTSIDLPYNFNIKPLPKLKLNKTKNNVLIDAKPDDWKEFPYSFKAENNDMEASFNIKYDDSFLYFAAKVLDDTLVSYGTGSSWTQDNIGFGFSALPISESAMSIGRQWYGEEFYQLITPKTSTAKSVLYRKFPEGADMKCVETDYGYFAEAKVPISYIENIQGKNWKTIRLIVVVDDKDGEKINRYYWFPNWRSKKNNIVGSGMFFKQ